GRLIADQHAGRTHQRPGDRDALALAAGKLRGQEMSTVRESHTRYRGKRPFAASARRVTAVHLRQHDVFQHGAVRQEMKRLKHEADPLAAEAGALFVRELGGLDSIQDIAAAGGTVEAADDVQQGRFAGAGRAGNRQPAAAIERQINIDQRVNRRLAAVLFANPFELEHLDRGAAFERDHFASLLGALASLLGALASLLGALSYPTTTSCPLARVPLTGVTST